MIKWGIASTATCSWGPSSLYLVRALVGLAEAGFLPGMLFYLGNWIPAAHRAKANAIFLAALPIAIMVGSPLSGLILQLDGWLGLDGWRWLFLIEGVPAIFLGIAAYYLLPDRKAQVQVVTTTEQSGSRRAWTRSRRDNPGASWAPLGQCLEDIGNREVPLRWSGVFCIVAHRQHPGHLVTLDRQGSAGHHDRIVWWALSAPSRPCWPSSACCSLAHTQIAWVSGDRYCAALMGLSAVGGFWW